MDTPRTATATAALAWLGLLGVGCPQSPTPTPSTGTSGAQTTGTTVAPATTFAAPDACQSTAECEDEQLRCVAPYDPGSDPPVGDGACVQVCIEADDLTRWCFDDEGCCEDLRCSRVDGFCEPRPVSDASSGTETATGSSTAGTGSTSDTGSSSTG